MNKRRAKRRFIIGCLTPAIILVTIFMIIPTINVFYMSLFKWGGLSNNKKLVWFDNFKILFEDDNFLRAMQNTILLVVVVTIITLFFAIIFASILSREKIKGQNFFRIVFYNPTTGLLNSLFDMLSLPGLKQMWMGNSNIALYSLAAALVWQAIGYYMVMYMASMSSIPENLYEAASLEGAGRMKQFFLVTLPLVWDNIRTTLTFFIISTINLSFLFVKIMTGGGPNGATEVFLSYMYNQAYTNSSYGYGMAIGVIVFIFSFILSGIVNKVTERDVLEF